MQIMHEEQVRTLRTGALREGTVISICMYVIYMCNTTQRYTSMVSTYDHSTKTCERNMFLTTSAASYMDIDIDEVRYSYKAIL